MTTVFNPAPPVDGDIALAVLFVVLLVTVAWAIWRRHPIKV